MVDLSAEIFEGCLDALFDDFESAIVSKRGLLLNLYLWLVAHTLIFTSGGSSKNSTGPSVFVLLAIEGLNDILDSK